jgi:hypothetical protein
MWKLALPGKSKLRRRNDCMLAFLNILAIAAISHERGRPLKIRNIAAIILILRGTSALYYGHAMCRKICGGRYTPHFHKA